MSDCLHCDINDLVQSHIDRGEGDLAELAARLVESLADLVLLAPEDQRAALIADAMASFGQAYLERSGAVEPEESSARH
jgi:hypothetical protein